VTGKQAMNIPTWVWGLFFAVLGWGLARLQRKLEKRDEKIEAVAALRFELEFNLRWLDNIAESLNYLRDEAWVALKNKGYISYLQRPIPLKVIEVYDRLHMLNRHIRSKKERAPVDEKLFDDCKQKLTKSITELIGLLDKHYRRIGKNFFEA
jgi:hypothetical protein